MLRLVIVEYDTLWSEVEVALRVVLVFNVKLVLILIMHGSKITVDVPEMSESILARTSFRAPSSQTRSDICLLTFRGHNLV